LVYAGGILVLFLFVIMLVNLEEPRRYTGGKLHLVTAAVITLLLFGMLAGPFAPPGAGPILPSSRPAGGELPAMGLALFREYMFPFEVVSVLLLVAMIGAIVLGRPRT